MLPPLIFTVPLGSPSYSGSMTNLCFNKSGCPPFLLLLWPLIIAGKLLFLHWLQLPQLFCFPCLPRCPYNHTFCKIFSLVLQFHRYVVFSFHISHPTAVLHIRCLEIGTEYWLQSPSHKTKMLWGSNASRVEIKNWWQPTARTGFAAETWRHVGDRRG